MRGLGCGEDRYGILGVGGGMSAKKETSPKPEGGSGDVKAKPAKEMTGKLGVWGVAPIQV